MQSTTQNKSIVLHTPTATASQQRQEQNFWLWGTWGKRMIKMPFLTKKVNSKLRNVIIGQTFIIALKEDGSLVSWGEDKSGCLGLGDRNASPDPAQIHIAEFEGKIIDIQYGKHHVLALSNRGKVYAWGDNQFGQLGLKDYQTRHVPILVDELKGETIVQIIAVDSMSYALSHSGVVYAWGDNKDGVLALEHESVRVYKPEPMMRMKDTQVFKLEVKESSGPGNAKTGKTIIAYVGYADPLAPEDQIGGYERTLGEPKPRASGEQSGILSEGAENDIFNGVNMMRRVMDKVQQWWNHMSNFKHGAPYDESAATKDPTNDRRRDDHCTVQQLDTFVGLDHLEKASYELDNLIQCAKAQLQEVTNTRGIKNAKFMLSMFIDDCRLRREKIRRTVAARQLMDHVKSVNKGTFSVNSNKKASGTALSTDLPYILGKVRSTKVYDIFTGVFQEVLIACIECKIQVHEMQMKCLKKMGNLPAEDPYKPALAIINERWACLKRFSIYNLYQECNLRGTTFKYASDEEMLAFLVQTSDTKIDQIINADKRPKLSRDDLIPILCYELLDENAELRKMNNVYQLTVLIQREKQKLKE